MKKVRIGIKAYNDCEVACDEPIADNPKSKKGHSGFLQYTFNGSILRPVGNLSLVKELEAGVYDLGSDMQGPYLVPTDVKTDDLLKFDDKRQKRVLSEIAKFWDMRSSFENMGFMHKRGILLYGSPGTGKSCILKLVIGNVIKSNDIILKVKSPRNLTQTLSYVRDIEPKRRILAILEDVDEMCNYDEHSLLQLFDGDSQQDGICMLGTTNYLDRLPERMLRTGRFDRKIEIGNPDEKGRYAYFNHKLKGKEDDKIIDKLVAETEGLNFSQLKEILVSTYCLGYDFNETLTRIKNNLEPFSEKKNNVLDRKINSKLTASVIKNRMLHKDL